MRNFDYYSYIFDNEPKVNVRMKGEKIHSFFDPREFLRFGTGVMGKDGLRDQVVDMKVNDFLGLAEPIPPDDHKRHKVSSFADFALEVANGKDFNWDIPYLIVAKNEDDRWKVIGHDGRHRARLLDYVGYKSIPVHIKIADGSSLLDPMPKELLCQNDCHKKRDRLSYPFPITKDTFGEPYIEVKPLPPVQLPNSSKTMDEAEVTFKDHGKTPDACARAKAAFERNPPENLQYSRNITLPFRTYGEFLKQSKKEI